ncbi:MAG TPA: CocE/NonD family hydrolase [Candidatus Deferrimicrobiaceae bacterium]|nr:CocE/NonD family hydrolase [Candidatus Deferrimicrobiaceae bacterium]
MELRRDVGIPSRDGTRLSANLFLPAGDGGGPWPAVFNMDPYRKDDWSAGWDLTCGTYLAERGYAYCRMDVRGTGSSEGVALDEYTEAETRDGYDAVEWLAAQPWCTGHVGMWGLSYGGFTSLQVATLRPPHLRAIVPIQATDDRYTDDVHYVGGAMTVSELAQYAVAQVATNAMPPDPASWGEGWRERWRERLEATPPWLLEWARQQRDGQYWRRGSVAPDYGRIEAAVLHFAGWMDEYVDAALRMQARCVNAAAHRTIVGPWVHGLPDHAYPSPNIDWLRELIRWFDRWLKEIDNGVEDEPALTWFEREFTPPERFPARLNGSWRATSSWPLEQPRLVLALDGGDEPGRGRLRQRASRLDGEDVFEHRPTAGVRAGSLCWGAGHRPNGLAADLRVEEPNGPVYTSRPLEAPLPVLGPPVAVLHVTSSEPAAHLVVRLGDVAPDGAVEQVSEGILNLTHRDSHAEPSPLEPGLRYEVRVPLRAAGHRFLPGHRLRLSLASAHWPVIWPSPGAARLTIHRGPAAPSRLELPLAPVEAEQVAPPPFAGPPEGLREFGQEVSEPTTWEVAEDPLADTVTVGSREAATTTLPDGRSTLYLAEALQMVASERTPGEGRFENQCDYRLERDGLVVEVNADGTTIAERTAFEWRIGLRVRLDGEPFFERSWAERIPRDLL